MKWFFCCLMLALLAGSVTAQDEDEILVNRNFPYVSEAHPRQVLDIYAPVGVDNYPVLMVVSGGGWTSGSKDWVSHFAQVFVPQGIGVVTVDHRLAPETHPLDQAADIASAILWLEEHLAEYGGDPTRIAVAGHSAGGHLIALAAMSPAYLSDDQRASIVGVIPISAALDAKSRFGEEGSPFTFVREGLPPFLILLASGDFNGLFDIAERTTSALRSAGVTADYQIIPQTDHFSVITSADLMQRIGQWLKPLFER